MKQLKAKEINNKFNSFIDNDKTGDSQIIIELTKPESVGGVSRDTNGDNLTVQLIQKTFTTSSICIVPSIRSELVNLFFSSDALESGDRFKGTVVVFKNAKGQRDYMTVPKYHYTSDSERDVNEKVQSRLGFGYKSDIEKSQNRDVIWNLIESISNELTSHSCIKQVDRDALYSLNGIVVEKVMEYTHSMSFSPKFIKETKNATLFGWMSFGTYASHPVTLNIKKSKKGIELIRLVDLGAETAGYYSHDNKYTCRPEHAQALKSFAKSFKSLEKRAK